ncbi:site-2 protease family protein [bacterium]|nr:site-2 protease family protein [bacterium]
MFKRSLRLFELWGIAVEIHISWIIVLLLVTWSFATGVYSSGDAGTFSDAQSWIMSLLTALLLFLSILLHEFSHSVVAVRNGLPIEKITLFMFGGVAQMRREVETPVVELKMTAAGPAMTLVLIGVFYLLGLLFSSFGTLVVLFNSLAIINGIIFIFNMVPGFPLDGGRILRAIIWSRTGNILKATRIASRIGKGFAFVLMGIGILNFFISRDFVGCIWMLMIGAFLMQAADRSYKNILYREVMEKIQVSEIIKSDVVAVGLSVDLLTLVEDFFKRYNYLSFPVVKDEVLVGIVTLDDVNKIDNGRWPETKVSDLVNRNLADFTVRGFNPAGRLLHLVNTGKYDSFPVVDNYGSLIGVVARSDFEEAVRVMASAKN